MDNVHVNANIDIHIMLDFLKSKIDGSNSQFDKMIYRQIYKELESQTGETSIGWWKNE